MSDIVEKTIAALPSIISGNLRLITDTDLGHSQYSRSFQAFVKHINNIKNKHEEEAVLERELSLQKQKLAKPNLSANDKRESLVRLVYCHMLGKDAHFACIHAVKLAQQGAILEKKVGYLVCSLLMDPDDELVMLLVNTMQKDLSSSNVLYNLAGLTAVVHLCGAEMVPAMLPLVKDKLTHPKDAVRKKAVLAMLNFLRLAPDMMLHDVAALQNMLSDTDPSVVWAALHVFSQLVPTDPGSYQHLVPGLVRLLGQVIGRRLVSDYDYHTVPAPWMTLVILRILAKLGAHDQSASQQIYPVLKEVLQRTESSHKMGLAVIFECLQTITQIYPYPHLVDQAVSCVGKFLSAKNINLKYLGLKALVSMVSISPQCTVEHQEIILDCLEHPDPTIQRKTLELLYKMADSSNVKVISDKMLEFMTVTSDQVIRGDIVHKVIDLTQRFSSNLVWYLEMVNRVVCMAENFIPNDTAQTVLWKISQGCVCQGDESDPLSNRDLRASVFTLYWKLLVRPALPETLVQIAVWVLGEYNHCVRGVSPQQVLTALLHWYTKSSDDRTHCQILAALQKMAYYITDPQTLINVLKHKHRGHQDYCYELKQKINELQMLCSCKQDVKIAANPETRTKLDELDLTLSFLDKFVYEALENGAAPYRPQIVRDASSASVMSSASMASSLNFSPYQTPLIPSKSTASSTGLDPTGISPSVSSSSQLSTSDNRETGLKLKSRKKVWGSEGVIKEKKGENRTSPNRKLTRRTANTEENTPPDQEKVERSVREMTPEQVKRKELAYAIFGKMNPKPQLLNEKEDLVTLSTSDLIGNHETVPKTTSQFCHTPPSSLDLVPSSSLQTSLLCDRLPPIHSPTGQLPQSPLQTDQLPEAPSPSVDILASPESVVTTPDSRQSTVHLLSYASIMSPEDQVLSGSLFHSFSVEKGAEEHINVEGILEIDELEKASEEHPKTQTMYEDFITSTHSGSSDDFVHQVLPDRIHTNPDDENPRSLETKNQSPRSPAINSTAQSMLTWDDAPISPLTKNSHPSPWKLLGPRKTSNNYEESIDDSISIEVDSIEEEEPPSEFNVETNNYMCVLGRRSFSSDVGYPHMPMLPDLDRRSFSSDTGHPDMSMLPDLDSLPMSDEQQLLESELYICGCQKLRHTGGLILVLYWNSRSETSDRTDDTATGSLLVDQTHYHVTLQKLSSERSDCDDDINVDGPVSAVIPSVMALSIEPLLSTVAALNMALKLPDQSHPTDVNVNMALHDFIRPLKMEVEEFGQSWTSDEMTLKRTSIPISEDHCEGHIKVIKNLGFQMIQEIGSEVLFSSQWLGTSQQVLLLHCKHGNNALQISVKGLDGPLVSEVISCIHSHITDK